MEHNKISKLAQIRAITQQQKDVVLKNVYEVDLNYAKTMLDGITLKSKALWDKKNGQAQVSNTYDSNLTGHMAELAVRDYFVQYGFSNVDTPDIHAYRNNQHETSPYDIVIDDSIFVQVKGISDPMDFKYQVTEKNTLKYNQDGTSLIVFVYVDKVTFKAFIYGITTPKDLLESNTIEDNMNRDPAKRKCYSARHVAQRPWMMQQP